MLMPEHDALTWRRERTGGARDRRYPDGICVYSVYRV